LRAAKLLEGTITFTKVKTAPVHGVEGAQAGDARQALRKLLDRPRVPLRAHATMFEDPETKTDSAARRLWNAELCELHERLFAAIDATIARWGKDAVRCCLFPNSGARKS